jgi:hypothetical protein
MLTTHIVRSKKQMAIIQCQLRIGWRKSMTKHYVSRDKIVEAFETAAQVVAVIAFGVAAWLIWTAMHVIFVG